MSNLNELLRPDFFFTNEELFALSEFFNNDNYSVATPIYEGLAKKILVTAVKAGLYDHYDWNEAG